MNLGELVGIIGGSTSLILGVLAWYLKKKSVDLNGYDHLQKLQIETIESLRSEIKSLSVDRETYRRQAEELQRKVAIYEEQVKELHEDLEKANKTITELKALSNYQIRQNEELLRKVNEISKQ